jgi:ABC-type sugar transport system ATPase subunit
VIAVLSGSGLTKIYGRTPVLQGVDLDVRAGEVHAVVGENGAGKSTLIRVLTGAARPDSGVVRYQGVKLPADPRRVQALGVRCVYQELTLVPHMTVSDNIGLGREAGPFLRTAVARASAEARLRELGARCTPEAMVGGLSVAQQQLVEIARALEGGTRVLILDEPTASLSAPEADRLLELLRRLRAQGMAIVYVSHRLDEIFAIADRITVLRDGRVVATASSEGLTREQMIRWMVGRPVSEEFPARGPRPGVEVLQTEELSAAGRFHDISFAVRAGEILGIGGLVGAGRTSLGMALGGALQASGTILLEGRPVRFRSPADAIRQGVAYLTEDRKARGLFPAMSVISNLTITYLRELARAGIVERTRERAAAESIAHDVRIAGVRLAQAAGTLSGGTQQKVLLGRFLLKPLKVVVLDEPTRGVDVGARAEIYALMNRLTDEGIAIVMISSDLPELLGMADRVLVMRAGRISGELSRTEASPERVMALAAHA